MKLLTVHRRVEVVLCLEFAVSNVEDIRLRKMSCVQSERFSPPKLRGVSKRSTEREPLGLAGYPKSTPHIASTRFEGLNVVTRRR